MSKKIMKISASKIDQLINEELKRHKKIKGLKSELASINEEMENIQKELNLNEVEVDGRKDGEQWYEKGMPKQKFDKKVAPGAKDAAHLKEDEFGDEMAAETFEQKLAAIGRELDSKLASTDSEEEVELPEPEEEIEVDGEEEIEIPSDDSEDMPVDDIEIEDDTEKEEDSEEEEMVDEEKKDDEDKEKKDIITGEEALNEGRKSGSKSASEVLQEMERARMKKLAGI